MKLSAGSIRVLVSFSSSKCNSPITHSGHLILSSTNPVCRLSSVNPISINWTRNPPSRRTPLRAVSGVPQPPLDLTEDNIRLVIEDAEKELGQLFDRSVGITGKVELYELDGPYVKISLKGRFWHKRSTVLARIGNYLKQRIPEILEVDIEDEKQLDDSPANF